MAEINSNPWNAGGATRETFDTPYRETSEHRGKRIVSFSVVPIERNPDRDDHGDQYDVILDDGTALVAWPEEVLLP